MLLISFVLIQLASEGKKKRPGKRQRKQCSSGYLGVMDRKVISGCFRVQRVKGL
jgi:hypothetical protein